MDLGNLAILYSQIGQNIRANEYGEQALLIDREAGSRDHEAADLMNLGNRYTDLGRTDEALRCHGEALAIARGIGYCLIEAAAHANLGRLHASLGNWDEAVRELEQAIEIADEIGSAQFSKRARESLAMVNFYRNNLGVARDLVEGARKYDDPLGNQSTSATLGVVALRQGDLPAAREAFTAALKEASQLIALCADRYAALDTRGLSFCGLALCGDPAQIPAAKAAYKAARAFTSDPGITHAVLQIFDALAQADSTGVLAEVRPAAAGIKPA